MAYTAGDRHRRHRHGHAGTDPSGLMEKLGISVDNVTSADSKDSKHGTRLLTEEERAYYQDQVDRGSTRHSIQTVAEGRDMPVEDACARPRVSPRSPA